MAVSTEIVIVGGGTAGITVSARLCRELNNISGIIIEPTEEHYYQPFWTLNGAGILNREVTKKPEADLIPPDFDWLQDAVTEINPEKDRLTTMDGTTVEYDYLIMAPGIQLDWDAIPGLEGNVGEHGICSNYSYETVDETRKQLETFNGGTALFTMPDTPVKCPGAPQKIVYLADDVFRQRGVRGNSELIFSMPGNDIFGVEKYAQPLREVVERKNLHIHYGTRLAKIEPQYQNAIIEEMETGETTSISYDMIHVTPPQSAPDFLESTGLVDGDGWIDVDPQTLQHTHYQNVFSLGDASNLPTSKTGAAIRKQVPVLVQNLKALRKGRELTAEYNGYTACPLVTGFGSLVMAEFDYEGNPQETFPINQGKERRSMYWVKRYLLPKFYWYMMLNGRGL